MKRSETEKLESARVAELPPFLSMAAVYRDRLRMMKWWSIGVTVVALVVLGLQEARFHGALAKYTNREVLVVPGAVDFMRVRPNTLPDSVVYYFAEYIAGAAGTFNYQNVADRAKRVAEFSTPEFAERFLSQARRNQKQYDELTITEIFSPRPVTRFALEKDAAGNPHYVVNVEGRLDRYSSDTKLASEDEVMTIRFRTTRIQADKPWFFEVEDLSRQSVDEFRRQQAARERLSSK